MHETLATAAQAFELCVARAAAHGRLEVATLTAAYADLLAAGQPAPPRELAMADWLAQLQALPPGLWRHPHVWLVRSLAPFACVPQRLGAWQAGTLPDGTLLLALDGGPAALVGFALALAEALHLRARARSLLEGLPTPADDLDPAAALQILALALGQAPAALAAAVEATGGAWVALLWDPLALHTLYVHADLDPRRAARDGAAAADRLVQGLAERGLLERPLHLWLGDEIILDWLSPYPRELRQPLWAWARRQPAALGADVAALDAAPSEELLYALARDLAHSDAALWGERCTSERTVGIERYGHQGLTADVVELGRLQLNVADARLAGCTLPAGRDVLLRLPEDGPWAAGAGLAPLLARLGTRVHSLTLTLPATLAGQPLGALSLPAATLGWQEPAPRPLPAAAPSPLAGRLGTAPEGVALWVPSAAAARGLGLQARLHGCPPAGQIVGSTELIDAVAQPLWRGALAPGVDIAWALVHGEREMDRRPPLSSLLGLSRIAGARLQQWLAPRPPGGGRAQGPAPARKPGPLPPRLRA